MISDSAKLTTYGFFYPIYLSAIDEKTTLIEVGIKSKAFQLGPIVTRCHEQCFNEIKATMLINEMS